jgi:DNA-binding MarR family transcriptional regulator
MAKPGEKQTQIANILLAAADRGEYLTLSDLHAALPYKCAYGSLRKNIDALEAKEWIERSRAGKFVYLKPKDLLYAWFRR